MKHKGAKMEYSKERMDNLMRTYEEYVSSCTHINMSDVCKAIVDMPSERFWVSEIRASLVVSAMIRGKADMNSMHPLRREMYEEIYRRVMELRNSNPELSVSEACAIVVEQPAPKFYLTAGSAKVMIFKARKEWIREKWERLLRL